jgi:hypothetical protein
METTREKTSRKVCRSPCRIAGEVILVLTCAVLNLMISDCQSNELCRKQLARMSILQSIVRFFVPCFVARGINF